MNRNRYSALPWLLLVLSAGAEPIVEPRTQALPGGIEVKADHLEFFMTERRLEGTGAASITRGEESLHADHIKVWIDTMDIHARGNVHFRDGDRVWRGDSLAYNLRTRTGDFGEFDAFFAPYHVHSRAPPKMEEGVIYLENVTLSTCDATPQHQRVWARRATVDQGRVRARHVVYYIGNMPVLYLPVARFGGREDRRFEFVPGYSSRWGAFALTGYRFNVNPHLRGVTRLDYRTRRGWAGGQDLYWQDDDRYEGLFKIYILDDENPMIGNTSIKEESGGVDSGRYRFQWRHRHDFSPRDTLRSDFSYVSDPFILSDFFRREYRYGTEPETRASYTHRADAFTVNLLVEKRLNDFYHAVDRLPEAILDVRRRRLGEAGPYYDSRTSAVVLQRLFADGSLEEDYNALRIDTQHTLAYPMRHFGFLNVIPRAGYRATLYSKTREEYEVVTLAPITEPDEIDDTLGAINGDNDANGEPEDDEEEAPPAMEEIIERRVRDGPGGIRHLFEIGASLSFKAFREYVQPQASGWGGMRHVSEPYTDYTLIPAPNLEPGDLYQFDAVDRLGKRHDLRLGWRNSFQTKRAQRIYDVVYTDIYTFWLIDPNPGQDDFSPLVFDVRLHPVERLTLRVEGIYDAYASDIPRVNARSAWALEDGGAVRTEYRFERDQRDLARLEIDVGSRRDLALGGYWRYNFNDSLLEEQGYYLRRRAHCMGWTVGYNGRGEDWEIWMELWLLAFPERRLTLDARW